MDWWGIEKGYFREQQVQKLALWVMKFKPFEEEESND